MSDLISRQAAIDAMAELQGRASTKAELKGISKAWKRIKELPPIQPDIVRCKDCKYAEYIDDVKTFWCTECGQGRTVAPNDYCSYAEREVNNESN